MWLTTMLGRRRYCIPVAKSPLGALEALGKTSYLTIVTGRQSMVGMSSYSMVSQNLVVTCPSFSISALSGNAGELHETAIKFNGAVPKASVVSGSGTVKQDTINGTNLVLQYTTTGQTVVEIGDKILLYILGTPSFLCVL